MLELEVGNKVSLSLIKNSPEMIVESISDEHTVICVWFNNSNDLKTASFKKSLLTKKTDASMLDAM